MSQPGAASSYPRERPTNVIVQQPSLHYNPVAERRHQKVRSFNNEIILAALLVIGAAIWARSLYDQRPCLNTLVHQPNKEISIKVFDIRDMHLQVVYFSLFVLIVALAKASCGQSKSYACYLLVMNVTTLIATFFTGYLAYLAFYSPCTLKPGEILASGVKTLFGQIADSMPSPDKQFFAESNVVELMKDDIKGFYIFIFDLFNFVTYFIIFVTGVGLC